VRGVHDESLRDSSHFFVEVTSMGKNSRRAVLILFAVSLAVLTSGAPRSAVAEQQASAAGTLTPLVVSTTNAPIGVLGSDGQEHLDYDLIISNVFTAPVTLTSLDVTAQGGNVLLHLGDAALAANTQPFAFTVGESSAPISAIPIGGLVATVVDVAIPPDTVPAKLSNVLTYELPPDAPGLAVISGRTVFGPELAVDPRGPLTIAPPLRGTGWINLNSCCDASVNHRSIREALDGAQYIKPEMFAIDWERLRDGQLYSGDGNQNEQYVGFGADVVSVAPGTVVEVRDDMPDQMPNQAPTGVNALDDYIGNHVVVQIQPDVWALYAHLQSGSVAVHLGDQVTTGQLLGRLGNSGNSFGAHLHFQLSDGPVALTSNSLPFVLDRYTLAGIVDLAAAEAAAEAPEGADVASVPINVTSVAQTGTYPLALTLQDFP
jgi:hypothetical protein